MNLKIDPEIMEREKETRVFERGEVIFKEGSSADKIYFLIDGCVKTHKEWGQGREFILRFSKPGDIVGYRGIGGDYTYPITATVVNRSKVCFFSLSFFNTLLDQDHHFTRRFLNFHLNELRVAEKRMRDLALMEVKGRIADTILMLGDNFGMDSQGYVKIELKRQDLAFYAGTTYETYFRTIKELVLERAIASEGKRLKIENRALLEQYCRS